MDRRPRRGRGAGGPGAALRRTARPVAARPRHRLPVRRRRCRDECAASRCSTRLDLQRTATAASARHLDVGAVEILVRGVDVDPDALRLRLKLRRHQAASPVVITRHRQRAGEQQCGGLRVRPTVSLMSQVLWRRAAAGAAHRPRVFGRCAFPRVAGLCEDHRGDFRRPCGRASAERVSAVRHHVRDPRACLDARADVPASQATDPAYALEYQLPGGLSRPVRRSFDYVSRPATGSSTSAKRTRPPRDAVRAGHDRPPSIARRRHRRRQSLVLKTFQDVGGARPQTYYESFTWDQALRADRIAPVVRRPRCSSRAPTRSR